MIQLIPQRVAIEFACCCVERVMEYLEEIYPIRDTRPGQLLHTIRAWTKDEVTKRAVINATEAFGELVHRSSLVADDWEDEDEIEAIGRATCASDALALLSTAVQRSPKSSNWWQDISGCLCEVHYSARDKKLPAWQREQLIRLIQSRELGM